MVFRCVPSSKTTVEIAFIEIVGGFCPSLCFLLKFQRRLVQLGAERSPPHPGRWRSCAGVNVLCFHFCKQQENNTQYFFIFKPKFEKCTLFWVNESNVYEIEDTRKRQVWGKFRLLLISFSKNVIHYLISKGPIDKLFACFILEYIIPLMQPVRSVPILLGQVHLGSR